MPHLWHGTPAGVPSELPEDSQEAQVPLGDSVNEPHLRQVDMGEECNGQYLFLFIPLQNICFIWDIWDSDERQENRVIWCANAIKSGIRAPF